jgi:hypothetical protein
MTIGMILTICNQFLQIAQSCHYYFDLQTCSTFVKVDLGNSIILISQSILDVFSSSFLYQTLALNKIGTQQLEQTTHCNTYSSTSTLYYKDLDKDWPYCLCLDILWHCPWWKGVSISGLRVVSRAPLGSAWLVDSWPPLPSYLPPSLPPSLGIILLCPLSPSSRLPSSFLNLCNSNLPYNTSLHPSSLLVVVATTPCWIQDQLIYSSHLVFLSFAPLVVVGANGVVFFF